MLKLTLNTDPAVPADNDCTIEEVEEAKNIFESCLRALLNDVGTFMSSFYRWDTEISELENDIATVKVLIKEFHDILKEKSITPTLPPTTVPATSDDASVSDSVKQKEAKTAEYEFDLKWSAAENNILTLARQHFYLGTAVKCFKRRKINKEEALKDLQNERQFLRCLITGLTSTDETSSSLPTPREDGPSCSTQGSTLERLQVEQSQLKEKLSVTEVVGEPSAPAAGDNQHTKSGEKSGRIGASSSCKVETKTQSHVKKHSSSENRSISALKRSHNNDVSQIPTKKNRCLPETAAKHSSSKISKNTDNHQDRSEKHHKGFSSTSAKEIGLLTEAATNASSVMSKNTDDRSARSEEQSGRIGAGNGSASRDKAREEIVKPTSSENKSSFVQKRPSSINHSSSSIKKNLPVAEYGVTPTTSAVSKSAHNRQTSGDKTVQEKSAREHSHFSRKEFKKSASEENRTLKNTNEKSSQVLPPVKPSEKQSKSSTKERSGSSHHHHRSEKKHHSSTKKSEETPSQTDRQKELDRISDANTSGSYELQKPMEPQKREMKSSSGENRSSSSIKSSQASTALQSDKSSEREYNKRKSKSKAHVSESKQIDHVSSRKSVEAKNDVTSSQISKENESGRVGVDSNGKVQREHHKQENRRSSGENGNSSLCKRSVNEEQPTKDLSASSLKTKLLPSETAEKSSIPAITENCASQQTKSGVETLDATNVADKYPQRAQNLANVSKPEEKKIVKAVGGASLQGTARVVPRILQNEESRTNEERERASSSTTIRQLESPDVTLTEGSASNKQVKKISSQDISMFLSAIYSGVKPKQPTSRENTTTILSEENESPKTNENLGGTIQEENQVCKPEEDSKSGSTRRRRSRSTSGRVPDKMRKTEDVSLREEASPIKNLGGTIQAENENSGRRRRSRSTSRRVSDKLRKTEDVSLREEDPVIKNLGGTIQEENPVNKHQEDRKSGSTRRRRSRSTSGRVPGKMRKTEDVSLREEASPIKIDDKLSPKVMVNRLDISQLINGVSLPGNTRSSTSPVLQQKGRRKIMENADDENKMEVCNESEAASHTAEERQSRRTRSRSFCARQSTSRIPTKRGKSVDGRLKNKNVDNEIQEVIPPFNKEKNMKTGAGNESEAVSQNVNAAEECRSTRRTRSKSVCSLDSIPPLPSKRRTRGKSVCGRLEDTQSKEAVDSRSNKTEVTRMEAMQNVNTAEEHSISRRTRSKSVCSLDSFPPLPSIRRRRGKSVSGRLEDTQSKDDEISNMMGVTRTRVEAASQSDDAVEESRFTRRTRSRSMCSLDSIPPLPVRRRRRGKSVSGRLEDTQSKDDVIEILDSPSNEMEVTQMEVCNESEAASHTAEERQSSRYVCPLPSGSVCGRLEDTRSEDDDDEFEMITPPGNIVKVPQMRVSDETEVVRQEIHQSISSQYINIYNNNGLQSVRYMGITQEFRQTSQAVFNMRQNVVEHTASSLQNNGNYRAGASVARNEAYESDDDDLILVEPVPASSIEDGITESHQVSANQDVVTNSNAHNSEIAVEPEPLDENLTERPPVSDEGSNLKFPQNMEVIILVSSDDECDSRDDECEQSANISNTESNVEIENSALSIEKNGTNTDELSLQQGYETTNDQERLMATSDSAKTSVASGNKNEIASANLESTREKTSTSFLTDSDDASTVVTEECEVISIDSEHSQDSVLEKEKEFVSTNGSSEASSVSQERNVAYFSQFSQPQECKVKKNQNILASANDSADKSIVNGKYKERTPAYFKCIGGRTSATSVADPIHHQEENSVLKISEEDISVRDIADTINQSLTITDVSSSTVGNPEDDVNQIEPARVAENTVARNAEENISYSNLNKARNVSCVVSSEDTNGCNILVSSSLSKTKGKNVNNGLQYDATSEDVTSPVGLPRSESTAAVSTDSEKKETEDITLEVAVEESLHMLRMGNTANNRVEMVMEVCDDNVKHQNEGYNCVSTFNVKSEKLLKNKCEINCCNGHRASVKNHYIHFCKICCKKFCDFKSLKDHILKHHTFVVRCEVCGTLFSSKKPLNVHMRVYHKELLFNYVNRNKNFSLQKEFSRHLQSCHENTRNKFGCDECNVGYSSEKNWKLHNLLSHKINFV